MDILKELKEKEQSAAAEYNEIYNQYWSARHAFFAVKNFKNGFMKNDQRSIELKISPDNTSYYGKQSIITIDVPNQYLLERLRQKFMDEKRKLNAMGIEFDQPEERAS